MFSRNLIKALNRAGILKMKEIEYDAKDDIEGMWDEYIGWGIGIYGAWFQFSHFWRLPFPFNIILFPVEILEWILRIVVNWEE